MADKCIDNLVSALSKSGLQLSAQEIQAVNLQYLNWKRNLQNAGKKPTDLMAPDPNYPNIKMTFQERFLNDRLEEFIEGAKDAEIAALQTNARVEMMKVDMLINMKELEKTYPNRNQRAAKAFVSTILTTNDTYGHATLSGMKDAEAKSMFGNLILKIKELLPEFNGEKDYDPIDIFSRGTTFESKGKTTLMSEDIIRELHHLRNNYAANKDKSITGNPTAFAAARAFIETVVSGPAKQINLAGRYTQPFDAFPQIIFKKFKMQKYKNADEFADFFHVHLSDKHGNAAVRKQLSQDIYTAFMNDLNYRVVNRIVQQNKELIADGLRANRNSLGESTKSIEDQIKQIPNILEYRDGDAFLTVNKDLGDVVGMGEILERAINENSNLVALVRMGGPQYERAFAKLRNEVSNDFKSPVYANKFSNAEYGDRNALSAADNYLKNLINPEIGEQAHTSWLTTVLSSARNVAVTKLGGAVISNMADLGTFGYVGWKTVGASPETLVKSVFGIELTGTKAEKSAAMAMLIDFSEVLVGSVQDRFRMLDINSGSVGSKMQDTIQKGSATIAHYTMKLTGFNALNRAFARGAASVMYRTVGDMITTRTAWDNLQPTQRQMFEKYGIFKIDYDELLTKQPVDSAKRLNLFAFPEESLKQSAPLQRKLMIMMNEMTETMVLKPGAFDRQLASFLQKPGSPTEQFARAILQFQTYMITFSRKILMNDVYNHKVPHAEKAKNLALLFAFTMIPTYFIGVAKDFVAGKEQKTFSGQMEAALRYTNYIPFLGDLYWEAGGQQIYDTVFGNGDDPTPTVGKFIERVAGPVITDFTSIGVNGFGLARAGITALTDKEEGLALLRSSTSRLVDTLNDNNPLANMWMTRAVWRHTVYDTWLEWLDPQGYKRTQRRLKKRALTERDEGQQYNFYGKILTGE